MKDNEFSTKDLHFAAFLKLKNVSLVRLERQDDYKGKMPVYFIFDNKEQCEILGNIFWGDGEEVNVKQYVDIIRDLRGRTSSSNQVINTKYESIKRI